MLASRALVAVAARSVSAMPGEVTLPQFRVLVVLATRGPQHLAPLADELKVVPSSMTRLAERLESKGLVSRAEVQGDRRQVQLRVTKDGRRVVDQVTSERRAEFDRLVEAIPQGQRPVLTEALRLMGRAAGEVPEQAWSVGWGE